MFTSKLENKYSERAEFIEVKDRKVVKTLGNLQKEYTALREGAMFYDCSTYGLFSVHGDKAELFLENLATKDIQYLNVGNVSECYFLNEEAEIVGNVFVVRRENDFIVISPWEKAADVKEWLVIQAKESEYEIEIKDLFDTMAIVSTEGPKSWKVVKKIFGVEIENLALRASMSFSWSGQEILLIRAGRSSEYGYIAISSIEGGLNIYDKLLNEEGQWDFPVNEGGLECIELAMLEVHQPNFLRETSEHGNIFELAQQWQIQYDKEDYIGYEKMMEIFKTANSKGAVGFVANESQIPYEAGDKIYLNEACIGHVVYSLYSIKLCKPLGIALLNNPYANAGLTLEVKTPDGVLQNIQTISGPFIRPLSWDQKME
ncbi:glycine cleavage T C-terminal barrel domain-containing protein [Ruminiclostridium papyrosolvens]|uniref:Glycine cleavage system protein T n=1 Tax=Ruminiclostridium papyrosolvens C7 TaxID=1330534 RepID=U4R1W7_9FIRM|nr:glycine cleavage T C-terminal barrel domain-containing protein [Ruminiclostridium papyrosolvens]EPR12220.1 hypothetical protein L323_09230 [Ruminiclostridium papyrosolvens C7]